MVDKESNSAINTLARGAVDGTGAFLSRICLPAAEEFGLLIRDKVKAWRNKNFVATAQKAEQIIEAQKESNSPNISPRLLNEVYENSSWIEDEKLQDMWAGLFASSCLETDSERNIIYMDILAKVTSKEARLFKHFCKSTEFSTTHVENLVEPLPVSETAGTLKEILQYEVFEDVAEALNNLELLGLIKQEKTFISLETYDTVESAAEDWEYTDGEWADRIEISITNLGFRLYLKAIGVTSRPSEYVKAKHSPSLYDYREDF